MADLSLKYLQMHLFFNLNSFWNLWHPNLCNTTQHKDTAFYNSCFLDIYIGQASFISYQFLQEV